MTTYYPVYIQLNEQPCVVIGGGKIAEGKVDRLAGRGRTSDSHLTRSHVAFT